MVRDVSLTRLVQPLNRAYLPQFLNNQGKLQRIPRQKVAANLTNITLVCKETFTTHYDTQQVSGILPIVEYEVCETATATPGEMNQIVADW